MRNEVIIKQDQNKPRNFYFISLRWNIYIRLSENKKTTPPDMKTRDCETRKYYK